MSANAKYTLRFAMQIGGLCRAMTIADVARRMHLDWHAVKNLDMIYMREQIARAGHPAPRVIGIDEISIRKRHVYRIVVSDLEQKRAIWFGGDGRGEMDMDMFYAFLGAENANEIRLAVMDMWKPFRHSTRASAPNADILFDKFHVLRHLGEALDTVRKAEYARVTGDQRRFIKGQKYVLLSHRENLGSEGNRSALACPARARQTAFALRRVDRGAPSGRLSSGKATTRIQTGNGCSAGLSMVSTADKATRAGGAPCRLKPHAADRFLSAIP